MPKEFNEFWLKTAFKVWFVSMFLIGAVKHADGQYNETIRSGRPGQAIGPFTVGASVFQLQAGTDIGGYEVKGVNGYSGSDLAGGSVFRYGFTERFEISGGISYAHNVIDLEGQNSSSNGINALAFAVRSNVYVGKGLIPSVGYQIGLGPPWLGKNYKRDNVAPKVTLMTGQSFCEDWGFITNWGATWNGNNGEPIGFYVLNLSYSISNSIGVFAEHYANYGGGDWDGKFDGGIAYLVNNDLQLDFYGGYDKNGKGYSDWFLSLGVSWRVKHQKKEKE